MENGVEYERIFVKKSVRELIVGDKTVELDLIGDYKFCVRAIIKEGVRFCAISHLRFVMEFLAYCLLIFVFISIFFK